MTQRSAVRVGDSFPCGCPTPVPHVCGKVMGDPGAGAAPDAVLIGGRPAATLGDVTLCVPNVPGAIVGGAATVFIHGKALARTGDPVSHGAVLAQGCPDVFVGA